MAARDGPRRPRQTYVVKGASTIAIAGHARGRIRADMRHDTILDGIGRRSITVRRPSAVELVTTRNYLHPPAITARRGPFDPAVGRIDVKRRLAVLLMPS
jgi:hypothetical protein